jgi:hypothetical protein
VLGVVVIVRRLVARAERLVARDEPPVARDEPPVARGGGWQVVVAARAFVERPQLLARALEVVGDRRRLVLALVQVRRGAGEVLVWIRQAAVVRTRALCSVPAEAVPGSRAGTRPLTWQVPQGSVLEVRKTFGKNFF